MQPTQIHNVNGVPTFFPVRPNVLATFVRAAHERGLPIAVAMDEALKGWCAPTANVHVPDRVRNQVALIARALEKGDALPKELSAIADVVRTNESYWYFPRVTLGQIEDGIADCLPTVDRARVAADWRILQQGAQRTPAALSV